MNKTALNSQKEKHSMLSLRRATGRHTSQKDPQFISIHALLAESDENNDSDPYRGCNFYPRSPCGERPCAASLPSCPYRDFYPRSPCGERHRAAAAQIFQVAISIHALLAESDSRSERIIRFLSLFLSTLSLRRATDLDARSASRKCNFYPRSPCGERPMPFSLRFASFNFYPRSPCGERQAVLHVHFFCVTISIHALLAESDILHSQRIQNKNNFYPRSPCGERRKLLFSVLLRAVFLSTLSLRRATALRIFATYPPADFYPRSPCGERQPWRDWRVAADAISIHALLAESDLQFLSIG